MVPQLAYVAPRGNVWHLALPVGLLQTVRREEVKVLLSPLFVATSANSMGFTGKS